ncbi:Uncharacterized protein, contains caspase domain [Bradyrhizobium lablabi]|jgi:uncharacterized caspase-like protein|uniref:Uncharacterized protein, contains caspase domain n=3 Tax=Nitrobacteraceae TaxID=41294 RepID=A0ABY0Q250_9BRAD|nr:Uncharacterized protein, contains caspase domain [Bradyrhizobium ottawaense]SEC63499.1 Uncharacterized protein, contains caspase domain [Bradyrhizobium lablabi]
MVQQTADLLMRTFRSIISAKRALGIAGLSAILIFCGLHPAHAERRVALVIGNSAYQNVAKLSNPANDSAAMAATFKEAGFDVVELKRDLKTSEMRRALRDFSDAARDSDVAIVFYAGHGIEIDGANYLIPTDAVLERDIDAFDEAIPLDRLLAVIEPARKLRLVILDACRDNPFVKSMKRTIASRAIGRGLAQVEPGSANTLIAFAAKAGSTASDGDGKNSPFTAALVKYLPKPGLDLRKAFGFARDEVLKSTGNRQEPFIYGSLGGEDFPLVAAVPVPAASNPGQAMRRDYELAERVATLEAWDLFIATYHDGFYAKLAQAQRNKLEAEQSRLAAIEKARLAEEERARLAAEGAKATTQAKAAADAKAAAKSAEEARAAAEKKTALEEARIAEVERAQAKAAEEARVAADKKQQNEAAKAAEVERSRLAQQTRLAEDARIAAENAKAVADAKAVRERLALERAKALAEVQVAEAARSKAEAEAKAEEDARVTAAKARAAEQAKAAEAERIRLAALAPAGAAAEDGKARGSSEDITRSLVSELRRVGCGSTAATDDWNVAAQKALAQYNKHAGTQFDVKVASLDALQSVRERPAGICPLVCEHGFEASGGKCVKIVCGKGYELSEDNACERVVRQKKEKPAPAAAAPKPRAAPAPEARQPEPARSRTAGGSMEARIAQCQLRAGGREGGGARNANRSFQRLDACLRGQ